MDRPREVRESHEQFRAAWTLYSRCSGSGEVVELDGLCIANSRHPWYLLNAAVPTEPVSSQGQLEALAGAAKDYYANQRRPWFFVGGQQWLGEDAAETLSRVGLAKAFSVTGMVTEQLAPPTRPLPEVETRRIDDEASQRELADLNAGVYNVTPEWVRTAVVLEALWRTPLYGYNAYRRPARVDGFHRTAGRRLVCRIRGHGARLPAPRPRGTRHAPELGERDAGDGHHAHRPPRDRRWLPRLPPHGLPIGRYVYAVPPAVSRGRLARRAQERERGPARLERP